MRKVKSASKKAESTQTERQSFQQKEQRLLERLAKIQEELEDAIWQLVRFYSHANRQDLSFKWVQQLMSITPNAEKQALHYLSLGQLMERVDNFEAAIDFYSQCLALLPQEKRVRYFAHNNTCFSLNQLLAFEDAEPYGRKAVAIDPTRHNAYKNLGVSLQGQGKYIDAALNYYKANKKEPGDRRALKHLEDILRRMPEIREQIAGLDDLLD